MAEKIRQSSPVYQKLCGILIKHEDFLSDKIQINVDPEDMPDDMEAALEEVRKIPNGKVFILDDESQKWLIPATSEEDVLLRVQAMVKKEKSK